VDDSRAGGPDGGGESGTAGPGIPQALRRFELNGRVAIVTGASSGLG
jgi:hypothetical protein